MNKLYDYTTLPINFRNFLDNFLKKIDKVGVMFFYPDNEMLMPGEPNGDKNMFDLAKEFKSPLKINLNDALYLIRVGICQQHFHVSSIKDEEFIERHENYRTIFIRAH